MVEDERVVAKDLQRSLARLGYDVPATAASAGEAIHLASTRCPDLVLMDIQIKGEPDGIETAEILRSRFDVPVIYLTARADQETVGRAKRTQPYGYLLKPVKADELRSAVEVARYKHEIDKRLRERERWFATTLRSIGDAVVSTDPSGRITFMNPAAETLTGWPSEEARGRPLIEVLRLVDESTGDAVKNPLERALRAGKAVRDAAPLPREGGERTVVDRATPIVDDSGGTLGAVLVLRDISEQQGLERRLELADRLASLGTMAAGVTHEIDNPLAFVITSLQFASGELRQHRQDIAFSLAGATWLDEVDNTLAEAQIVVERIKRTIADLRAFSRPETEGPKRANVRRVVEWAIEMAGRELRPRARVVSEFGEVPAVVADETRLGQVFVNLLLNAAHAITTENPEGHEVRVSTRLDDKGRVQVDVRDTGGGIPEEVMRKIFDPFFTTKEAGRATGLGLSICHGIVRSLGGEIVVKSQVGKGSLFRVVLPAAPPEERSLETQAEATTAGPQGHILVVDDEPLIRGAIRRVLSGQHALTVSKTSRQALGLIESGKRFDLIFCDLMMPETTGVELHEQLLRRYPDQARRMVFLTGGTFTTRASEFLRSVPNRRLEKPFDPTQLPGLAKELLETWGRTRDKPGSRARAGKTM